MHLEADPARGDDRADIAATDDAERLAGDFNTHEFRLFSHLPALGRGMSASGNCRATASIMAMACSAVVIELPNGVFMTMMPRRDAAWNVDIVDTDAGPADHFEPVRRRNQLLG